VHSLTAAKENDDHALLLLFIFSWHAMRRRLALRGGALFSNVEDKTRDRVFKEGLIELF
jgi:hypothetical protein